MYLDARRRRRLADTLHVLSAPIESATRFRSSLTASMASLLDADHVASYRWDPSRGRYADGVCAPDGAGIVDDYESTAQHADDIARRLRARRGPTRVSDVLSQRTLQTSAFFHDFLRPADLHWGLNLFAADGRAQLGDLRIWRSERRGDFSDDDLDVVRLLHPAIVGAFRRCGGPTSTPASSVPTIEDHLVEAFGLSGRQAQVASLAALGRSDHQIARDLGIGFTTVRSHLGAALARLGCANRKELIRFVARLDR